MIWHFLLLLIFIGVGFGTGYLYFLLIGSCLPEHTTPETPEKVKFAVIIPAHNEEVVIADSIRTINDSAYEPDLLQVYVVADHCSDATAERARAMGAIVLERNTGDRSGKGAALRWLFPQILTPENDYSAVVIFDADTHVDANFFQVMGKRIAQGEAAIQGKHVIRNPGDGWLPALTRAMFIIDNRVQNQGRARLGFSAKNMGDSICFQANLIQMFGWGDGLTEDYSFRQRLLLEGICIDYEPQAIGYGVAALNWGMARAQRSRWIRGVQHANRGMPGKLFWRGLSNRNLPIVEGSLQVAMPSYSTLTILTLSITLMVWLFKLTAVPWLPWAFLGLGIAQFLFPLVALALERAPLNAFLSILTGPVYIVWRTWLSLYSRLTVSSDEWVRTPRVQGK